MSLPEVDQLEDGSEVWNEIFIINESGTNQDGDGSPELVFPGLVAENFLRTSN